ncbi:MAG: hypothetical protein JO368_08620 [Acidimicrobiales bacterium]|nr:hypothetical protein [Acidimicrobiales bacterium]
MALVAAGALATTAMGAALVTGAPRVGAAAAPPQCSPGAVHIVAATDHTAYPPGRTVTMTASITNVSRAACTFYLGYDPGYSPVFNVTNVQGTTVWDRCWRHDEPAACFDLLKARTLDPGETYSQTATWDQRSGPDGGPVRQVPQGQYTYTTDFAHIGGDSTTFDIIVG